MNLDDFKAKVENIGLIQAKIRYDLEKLERRLEGNGEAPKGLWGKLCQTLKPPPVSAISKPN